MEIKIEAIRYQNIREFRELELDLTEGTDSPHHISLVQMPNGTGKTTTMKLIRTLLLGRELSAEEIESFSPNEFEAAEGSFEMDFRTPDEHFTLRLQLDYEILDYSYRHTKPKEVGGGDMASHYLPPILENIITDSFVDLFVFNGELTEDFIKQGENEAENALKIVNFLNRLEYQKNQIQEVVEEREEDENVTTEQGYKQDRTKLQKAKEQLEQHEARKEQYESEIKGHKEKIEELEEERDKLLAENEDQLNEYKRLTADIDGLKSDIESEVDDLLNQMRKPSQLNEDINDDLNTLLENMNIMQLPKSTSQEFFTQLAEEDTCICDRPVYEKEAMAILENSKKYLSEKDIGVLNSLKDQLRDTPEYTGFEDKFERLESKRTDLRTKRNKRSAVDIEDDNLSEKIEKLAEQKQEEESQLEEKKQLLDLLTTNDTAVQDKYDLDWKKNIPLCKSRRNKYQNRQRLAKGTVEFGKKADLLEDLFDDFINKCLTSLKEKQIQETNRKLERILGLSKVQVSDIDDSIVIKGRDGASEGQSLSIAYAYLSTLFEDSRVDVPFVIDSPAVSIDYDKRKEVAHMISNLFNQLLIFVISPEREQFVSELDSDEIQYLTVHKTETPGAVEKHTSKDYFMDFQSEEEVAA